jgi:hypothetical protein
MSFAIELYYHGPENVVREKLLVEQITGLGGKLDFRELTGSTGEAICLTFEFEDREAANKAANILRSRMEHVEGPYEY